MSNACLSKYHLIYMRRMHVAALLTVNCMLATHFRYVHWYALAYMQAHTYILISSP
jgi:BarA-like signal transduction histidine kinase